jgi:MCM OB domain
MLCKLVFDSAAFSRSRVFTRLLSFRYVIVGKNCEYIDQQSLKLQEAPETIPTGEMPRHVLLTCERYLVNHVVPGTRVEVIGKYAIYEATGRTARMQTVGGEFQGEKERERGGSSMVLTRVNVYVCMYVCVCTMCICVCMCMCTMFAFMLPLYVYVYVYVYIYIYIYMCVCVCVCVLGRCTRT